LLDLTVPVCQFCHFFVEGAMVLGSKAPYQVEASAIKEFYGKLKFI
jgi:hypothetical protein